MIQSNRSYADYEELETLFKAAKKHLDTGDHTLAAEALKKLYSQAILMWGPAPMTASAVGKLWGDVREGRVHPPYGDFSKRLEERRADFIFEYGRDLQRAIATGKNFVPTGKPNPPRFLAPEFTDEKRAMLKAIHEREGRWDEVDPDTEVANIGNGIGLEKDEAYALFKQLIDENYVNPGRILQAGGAMPGRTARVVGRGDELTAVGDDIRLTDKGLGEVADSSA